MFLCRSIWRVVVEMKYLSLLYKTCCSNNNSTMLDEIGDKTFFLRIPTEREFFGCRILCGYRNVSIVKKGKRNKYV